MVRGGKDWGEHSRYKGVPDSQSTIFIAHGTERDLLSSAHLPPPMLVQPEGERRHPFLFINLSGHRMFHPRSFKRQSTFIFKYAVAITIFLLLNRELSVTKIDKQGSLSCGPSCAAKCMRHHRAPHGSAFVVHFI